MNKCPQCGGKVRLRNLCGNSPYHCNHCGTALAFVTWRFIALTALCLLVGSAVADLVPHAHRFLRLLALMAAYFAVLAIAAPLLLRLKVTTDPSQPLSIR